MIDAAIDSADQQAANGELLAACRFARRRKLGPFDHRRCNDEKNSWAVMQRHLGSLARAGFPMAISHKVISLEDAGAVEMLINQLERGEDPTI